jgi:membrane protein DedA with SNARE-associated domain
MNWVTTIGAVVRHVMTFAAGYVVSKGLASAEQVEAIVGGATAVGMAGWAIWQKQRAEKALKDAIAAPAGFAK